jgi:hypothetical protein
LFEDFLEFAKQYDFVYLILAQEEDKQILPFFLSKEDDLEKKKKEITDLNIKILKIIKVT